MKKIVLISALIAISALTACGKKTTEAKADLDAATAGLTGKNAAAASAAASKPEDKPRLATYDPNLKPAKIVWDSPEKQKAWEAQQAAHQAEAKKAPAKQ